MKSEISKVDIICEQIHSACDMHLSGNFVGSLTLGGSADSLSSELVESRGHESMNAWHVKFIRFWNEKAGFSSPSRKIIHKERNWARNSIKHHNKNDDEVMDIDLEFESFIVIKGAIENYQRLGKGRTNEMNVFNERTKEYG